MADGKPTQGERLTRLEGLIETLAVRMDKMDILTDSVHKLASATEVMATDLQYTKKEVEKMGKQVECLMLGPAKKWDTASMFVITTIIGAVIGMIVGKYI